jgi:hypothetical protein
MAKDKKSTPGEQPGVLKIKFIASPTGKFNLAYNEGDEVEFPMAFAAELIELGFAEAVGSEEEA